VEQIRKVNKLSDNKEIFIVWTNPYYSVVKWRAWATQHHHCSPHLPSY